MKAHPRPPTFDDHTVELGPPDSRRLLAVTFHGRPGTANVAKSQVTRAWTELVRAQAVAIPTQWEPDMRFWARIDFRLYGGTHSRMEWDTDNLLKAFFDALADAGFFGAPAIAGSPLKGDERVDYLQVRKRTVTDPDEAGARIELYAVARPSSSASAP